MGNGFGQRAEHRIVLQKVGQCRGVGKIIHRHEFDVVITDKVMPEMNGDQLAVAVKSREPETRVILLTGFGGPGEDDEHSEFIDLVVAKPASLAELRAAILRAAARRELALRAVEAVGEFKPRPVHLELLIFRQAEVERLAR